jgi:hypothetical protein
MIVASDTTPLNYLIPIGSAHVLPALFGRVHAPSAVIRELAHPRSPQLSETPERPKLPIGPECRLSLRESMPVPFAERKALFA